MARPSSFEPIGGMATERDRVAPNLFDHLPIGIVVTDSHGEILEANKAAHDLLGLGDGKKRDLLFLNTDGSALPPADHPSARALRDQCVLADEQIGMEGPEGAPIWFQVTATHLPGVGVVTTYHDVTTGRRTEEDLRHHIDQLDAFFDTNLDLLAILNSDGRAVRLNPAWSTLLGYDLEQLDGARVLDFTHPSDMESTLGALARLRTRKEVVGFVSRMRHRKGSYRFLEWRATAGEDLIYATARDITDYRLAEAALRESEARFRAIFEQATVGVAEADAETGSYVRINQRFCDILGYSRDELMATGLDSLTHPKDLPQDLAILKGIQEDENRLPGREKRCLHKDGNTVWINLQVTALSESNTPTPHLVVVIEDISQRKKTDELLHKSLADVIETNQRLNFQITRMPLGYIAWDLEYHVTVWNASAERIFGWSAGEAIGRHVYHLMVPPEERAKTTQFWDAVVEGSDSSSHAILGNCTRDGGRITCEWVGAPDVDASGKIVGCLSMVHDVTQRIGVEEKVLHSQEIHSEPGRGTQAQITLPVSQAGPNDHTVANDRRSDGHGLRILLVEDDNLVQTAVCAQLRKLGHAITIANHGQEALDKLQEGLECDLVLLDIDMPVLSGGETLPRLRALRPSLPVVIETGNMGEQVEQLARAFADVSVLVRPFSLSELKAALAPWANSIRAGAATS